MFRCITLMPMKGEIFGRHYGEDPEAWCVPQIGTDRNRRATRSCQRALVELVVVITLVETCRACGCDYHCI